MLQDIKSAFHNREMMRRIFSLAWPTVMEQAMQTIVQYADTAQVGVIGANASAAVGLTATMNWLINAPFFCGWYGGVVLYIPLSGSKGRGNSQESCCPIHFALLDIGFWTGYSHFVPDPISSRLAGRSS